MLARFLARVVVVLALTGCASSHGARTALVSPTLHLKGATLVRTSGLYPYRAEIVGEIGWCVDSVSWIVDGRETRAFTVECAERGPWSAAFRLECGKHLIEFKVSPAQAQPVTAFLTVDAC